MVSRLWLVGLLFAVPLAGFVTSQGIEARFNSDLRSAARIEVPDAPADRIAALAVADLCAVPDEETQESCGTLANIQLLGSASIIAATLGAALPILVWIGGMTARTNRELLLWIFRPGLHLTGLGLIALVLMHAGIAIASVYYAETIFIERLHYGIILAIGAGAVFGTWGIAKHALGVIKNAKTGVIGLQVSQRDAPELWQRINAVAEKLQALRPDNIVLGLDPNFYVTEAEVESLSGQCTGRTLYCSLPLLRILTVTEFLAVVGHELGHFKGRDTKFSQRFFPIYRGTANSIRALQQSGGTGAGVIALLPALALFSYFLECFSVAENRISRQRELEADRAGASVTSASAMAVALVKVHAFSGLWDDLYEATVNLVSQKASFLNASRVYADLVMNCATPEALDGIADTHLAHPTDSHPPLCTRLEALEQSLEQSGREALNVAPSDPAISLVRDVERKEQEVSLAYQTLVHYQLQEQAELERTASAARSSYSSV